MVPKEEEILEVKEATETLKRMDPLMSPRNCKYHELLTTVPDSLLTSNGYPKQTDCNCNGPLNAEKTALIRGDRIIFGEKDTDLESDFDAFVVEKNKDHTWAKTRTESTDWRPLE